MIRKVLAGSVIAAAVYAGAASTASAATFACKCDATFASSGIAKVKEKKPDLNLDCRTTWPAGKPANETDTGDYSGLVKATFPEAMPPDSITSIRIRPRNSEQCVLALYDQKNNHQEWAGLNCDTTQNTSRDGFDIVVSDPSDSTNTTRSMAGKAMLTTKNNAFLAFYSDLAATGKGKGYILLAACVEPK